MKTHQTDQTKGMIEGGPMRLEEPHVIEYPFPSSLVLTPTSRWPTELPRDTVETVLSTPAFKTAARNMGGEVSNNYESVSIVIVTYNNLVYTRLCLESLLANTDYLDYEVTVVDNGSIDGTAVYLRQLARSHAHVRVIFNKRNRGFAPANNQALARAKGDVLVLLNNDTLLPRGWLTRLVHHLKRADVGLVGPVTNRSGNEAQIPVTYGTYGEFMQFADRYHAEHDRELSDIRTLTMFCVAMRREVYERIGPLDERFEIGMFEDDDYAVRTRAAGYRVVCAEDIFVHHFGQASLGKLTAGGEYGKLFHENRSRFEQKWAVTWEPHKHRPEQWYQKMMGRIRATVQSLLPSGSSLLVVSRGDSDLLDFDGRVARHFPQAEDGGYAGHYPATSLEAIEHLEGLRREGAHFLLFPQSAFWWLEHYEEFNKHLNSNYKEVIRMEDTCVIFELSEQTAMRHELIEQGAESSLINERSNEGGSESMSISILTGVPGSGKSRRVIELVNSALAQGRPALTFACSDSPLLQARDSIRLYGLITCRIPGLTCPLNHFVSTEECAKILAQTPPGTLVAFDEAQHFGEEIVPHWLDASQRELEVLISTPSVEQLRLLKSHGLKETTLSLKCQKCGDAEANTFVRLPDEDATLSVCQNCYQGIVEEARHEIIERLKKQPPYPGEEAIYQPIEFEECADWKILRPDSQLRAELMSRIVREAGLPADGPVGQSTYLDIGCNTGYFCHRMRRLGFYAEGADVVEGDIKIARMLDSYFRRDSNTYVLSDAYDYLRDTRDKLFDVTSAFSVFQWVMMQRSVEDGIACLEWMFAKTKRVCFLEMGDSSEAHYKDKLGIEINREWTQNIMREKGNFSEIRLIDAQTHNLKRDIFIGIKENLK